MTEDQPTTQQPEPPEPDAAESVEAAPKAPPAPASSRPTLGPWIALAAIVVGGLVVTNVLLLNRVSDLETEIESAFSAVDQDLTGLSGTVGDVSDRVDDVSAMVDEVEGKLDSIDTLAAAGAGEASAAPSVGAVVTGLPRYDPSIPDGALGLPLPAIGGPEYYSGTTLEIDAADGTARAWLVWAHWCPFCQEEMPGLAEWAGTAAADFPDVELVSITTAMDESRGNPLVPYLDALELEFPVIVDADGVISAQLGLNAFPFWVFTGPDGTVLGRTAGLLGPERFDSIIAQLQDIAGAQT